MPYPAFDRSRLSIKPLAQRQHDLDLSALVPLDAPSGEFSHPAMPTLGQRTAPRKSAARIALMGAHVLRAGVARYLIDMMQRGDLTHLAMNGAGPIHDWEFALIGASTESVPRYIQTGEFGLWQETGLINDTIVQGARAGLGLGKRSGGPSSTGHSRTRTSACWRRPSASACPSPFTSASATTSSTNIPTAMGQPSGKPATRIS